MKFATAHWVAILGGVMLLLVAAHWAMSPTAPKPTYVAAIKPITNATNTISVPPVVVDSQDSAALAFSRGQPVYYEPIDPTVRGFG